MIRPIIVLIALEEKLWEDADEEGICDSSFSPRLLLALLQRRGGRIEARTN
ncbi:MAG: hypothetical protein Q8P67_11185 [archaeon]|nr:hypothetical protein [archaeon]